jgi:hypothetical protein
VRDVIFYSTLALTAILSIAAFVRARSAINKGAALNARANRYALAASAAGIFAGIPCQEPTR